MNGLEADWLGTDAEPQRNRGGRPAKDYRARGNRKLECPSCGFVCRCSAAAVARAGGLPSCACGERMVVPELRDRAVIEWDALAAELQEAGPATWNRAMRELGHVDAIVTTHPERRGGAERRRCTWDAGYCTRWPLSGSDRCREHAR